MSWGWGDSKDEDLKEMARDLDAIRIKDHKMKEKLRTPSGQFTGDFTQLAIHTKGLEAENARLRTQLDNAHKAGFEAGELANRLAAELEALRPKPVVVERWARAYHLHDVTNFTSISIQPDIGDNLKLTFEAGNLKTAQVKQDDGSWK